MTPYFSVVISIYNKEKHIQSTIESVLVQTFGDFEIVAGSPAKLIKKRFDEKTIKIINDSNWWNLDFSDANAKIKELEKLGIFEVDAN